MNNETENKNLLERIINKITPEIISILWAWIYGGFLIMGIAHYNPQYHVITINGWAITASGIVMLGFLPIHFFHSLKLIFYSFLIMIVPFATVIFFNTIFPAWGLSKALLD
jgi:hypothetical protein